MTFTNKFCAATALLATGILLMLTNNHTTAILFNGLAIGIFISDTLDKGE